jgi:cyclophilin family peptidyl-prolyl cis-trans isomerase
VTESLRPKIYFALCLLALFLEMGWIVAKAPTLCVKCKKTLAPPSREYPTELCQSCVEELRNRLAPLPTYYDPPYPVDPADPVVTLDTTRGRGEGERFAKRAPVSTENFLRYVRGHHYDGCIFHRLEDYLCVAGRHRGGYGNEALVVIPQFPPIPSESANGVENRIGTISLPHLDENENSATSDFFFNLKDNPYYNRRGPSPKEAGYAAFGQVIKGFEVLDALRSLPVRDKPWPRFPAEPVVIRRVFENAPVTGAGTAAVDSR